RQRAALLLTNEKGDNTADLVRSALNDPALARADSLTLVAGLRAIPLDRRPNPVPGKDAFIEMEPLTPEGSEPFTFAPGGLFHEDPAVVLRVLARQRLLAGRHPSPRALVVSNPGGSLPLMETFSRNTVEELRNRGYRTTALFRKETDRDE